MCASTQIETAVSTSEIVRADDDRRCGARQSTHMPASRRSRPRKERPTLPGTAIVRRFSRSDGRFDLPTVAGRTAKEIARRLA
jgi:hypothetical protein